MNESTNSQPQPQTKGQILAQKGREAKANPDYNKPTLVAVDVDTRRLLMDLMTLSGGTNRSVVKKLVAAAHAKLTTDEISALRVLERARNS